MLKQLTVFALSVFISSFVFAQNSNTSHTLTTEHYKGDFNMLRDALQKTYPSLYRFRSKADITKFLDSSYNSISEETDDVQFYALIRKLLSYIGDGHFSWSPSTKLRTVFQDEWQYFPLSIIFLNNKAYNMCENASIPKGSEIISINDQSIQNIRRDLFQYITSDGKIETGKNYVLNNAFWFYYNLAYGEQTSFNILYRPLNDTARNTLIYPVLRRNMQCTTAEPNKSERLLQLSFPQKNVALLTIKTFSHSSLTESKEAFPAFLDSAFNGIKNRGVSNLIIDVRGNGGGADVYGSYLYSFLTNTAFPYYSTLETSERALTVEEHPNLSIQKPARSPYTGKLYVLINGLSFSATTEFCSIVKSNSRGIFIGEETGGTYYGNTSGGSTAITLPNTQITVSIPRIKYSMAVREEKVRDRGIIPDFTVIPTIDEVMKNKDVQLEYAIRLASMKQ